MRERFSSSTKIAPHYYMTSDKSEYFSVAGVSRIFTFSSSRLLRGFQLRSPASRNVWENENYDNKQQSEDVAEWKVHLNFQCSIYSHEVQTLEYFVLSENISNSRYSRVLASFCSVPTPLRIFLHIFSVKIESIEIQIPLQVEVE